jgi:hypothetical protein
MAVVSGWQGRARTALLMWAPTLTVHDPNPPMSLEHVTAAPPTSPPFLTRPFLTMLPQRGRGIVSVPRRR